MRRTREENTKLEWRSDKILVHYKNNMREIMASLSYVDGGRSRNGADGLGDYKAEEEGAGEGSLQTEGPEHAYYCKLICSLALPVPEAENGHFWSLSSSNECNRCKRLIPAEIWHRVGCSDRLYTVTPTGGVVDSHRPSSDWDLTEHVKRLAKIYRRDWKRVYWKLWSECHYLFCSFCESYYPIGDPNGCRRHGIEAVFSFVEVEGVSTKMHPVGRFACCEAKAFRYECVPRIKDVEGCKMLPHTPLSGNEPLFESNIKKDDGPRKSTATARGLLERGLCSLITTNPSPAKWIGEAFEDHHPLRPTCGKSTESMDKPLIAFINACSEPHEAEVGVKRIKRRSEMEYDQGCCLPLRDVNIEDAYFNRPIQYLKRTNRHKKTRCGLRSDQWVNRFSTRYNQDGQRHYEDHFFKLLNGILSEKAEVLMEENRDRTGGSVSEDSASQDSFSSYCSTLSDSVRVRHSRTTSVWNSHSPLAGSFVRIETELKDACSRPIEEDYEKPEAEKNALLAKLNARVMTRARRHPDHDRKQNGKSLKTETTSKIKIQVPLPKDKRPEDFCGDIWSFDPHSQELDYLSAAYMPLPIVINAKHYRYFKPVRNELANEWDDMVDLEKAWNGFLWMFYENESVPSDDRTTVPFQDKNIRSRKLHQ